MLWLRTFQLQITYILESVSVYILRIDDADVPLFEDSWEERETWESFEFF